MEIWFSEMHTDNVKLSVRINRQLFSGESEYQRIDVFDSEDLGKFIALDGEIVFSDQDEFIYDEMVAHVPMAVHPNVKKVLIIGGGDGGVAESCSVIPDRVHRCGGDGSHVYRCVPEFSRRRPRASPTRRCMYSARTACGFCGGKRMCTT